MAREYPTALGLAIAAAIKGYRCIFVMPDKMSQEKIALLRAYGAEVVICPTAVDADSPESYYSVSDRLAEEIPGAFKPDQYSNMANPDAHYEITGPEVWEQTGGEIDAFVVSVGTGGTISGAGRYLKERNPDVLIVGADPEGSVYTAAEDSDIHPYLVEGIGKDTWPKTMAREVVDAAMQPPLAAIDADEPLDEVFSTLTGQRNAVVVARDGRPVGVLTRTDLLEFLAHNR